ncbi:MAG: aldehyde dehydrogenase (NADP(+)) [Flavobacteriaceae bacterium]|jgi:NADP-dependent aldehyde dehydrogenase|nr:MAG: aldehyde dehydrogenase (NADP(+)) [Flavobacteriaceae bacterium]
MQHPITGAQLIGYTESSLGAETFSTTNPRDGKHTPWSFRETTKEELQKAVEMAASAFIPFQELPGERRGEFLEAVAGELEAVSADLIEVYTLESGLPEARARGELGRTTGQLRAFADLARKDSWRMARIDAAQPDRQPVPKPDIRKCLYPLGPVAVFGASNFPFAFSTAGGDTASALAVGCPVVVKGHPLHAGTGEAVGRCVQKAARETGMPEGVFSHLQSSGISLGEQLVQHLLIKGVGFTGSRKAGLALSRLGQERAIPIPVFAEMGSINPVVVLPSATEESGGWAKAYAQSVTLGSGQFCTNPGLILGIAGPSWDRFVRSLALEISQVPAGCMLHRGMADRFRTLREELLSQQGVTVLETNQEESGEAMVGGTVAQVSGSDFCGNPSLQQEVFGPFTLTVGCSGREELLRAVQILEGQLTASILGDPEEIGREPELLSALKDKAGRLLFNGVPTGVEVCPSMHHGGPFPATTDARFTSVGTDAALRWVRPISFQNTPQQFLPPVLRDENPLGIWRMVNGEFSRKNSVV